MKANLHDWLFNYNTYTGLWSAAKREDHQLLFSDSRNKKVLRSKEIKTLIDLIIKSDGTTTGVKKFVKGQVKHVIVEG